MKNLTTLTSRRKEILMKVLELGLEKYDEEEFCPKIFLEEAIKDTVEHIEELKEIIIYRKKYLDLCKRIVVQCEKNILNNEIQLKEIESHNKIIIDEEEMIDFNIKCLEEAKEDIIRYQYELDNFVDIEETKEDLKLLRKDINDIPNSLFDMEEINKLMNSSKN